MYLLDQSAIRLSLFTAIGSTDIADPVLIKFCLSSGSLSELLHFQLLLAQRVDICGLAVGRCSYAGIDQARCLDE